MNRDKLHLLHIRDALDRIEEYSKDLDYTLFAKREVDFDAILMRVITIGEAVNSLSDEFKEKYHELPWHKAVGLRNQIAHGYIDVKPDLVWDTIKKDLPILKKDIEDILKQF